MYWLVFLLSQVGLVAAFIFAIANEYFTFYWSIKADAREVVYN